MSRGEANGGFRLWWRSAGSFMSKARCQCSSHTAGWVQRTDNSGSKQTLKTKKSIKAAALLNLNRGDLHMQQM